MHLISILNVVSRILIAHGVMMFFPIIISIIYDDSLHNSFLFSALITLLINFPIFLFTKRKINFSIKDAFATVTLTWFFVALFSTLPFLLSGTINNFTDAFFESMSGVSTTGATIITITKDLPNGIESLPHSILFWRSFTQWIGGMGIIVFSIAVLPLLGVGGIKLFRAEVPGPITQKIKPRIKDTAKILWMIYISFTIFQILLLSLAGMPWFDSICHAFTTMPTGGFSTQNSSINSYSSPIIQYIFIFFMFIAGINFSLHFKVINIGFKSYFKDFEFRVYTFIILIFSNNDILR